MKTLAELAAGFVEPSIEYSPIPFWFLNGSMDPVELTRQLKLMRTIGIGTVVLHARRGREVEYLSDEWFAGIRHCVETCAELGMKAWLYDEDNWPSGYAGGEVLRRYPGGQGKCLAMVPADEAGARGVLATVGTEAFVEELTPWHPAYAEGWYTDLLDRKATEVFIETTHERYAETLGEHMGTTVTAVFTDEPGFYNHFYECAPGTIVWTGDMLEQFEARRGYDLTDRLRCLFEDEPGADRTRIDFYRTVTELICERYYQPLKDWCHAHNVESVGHINNEEYLVDHVRYNADMFSAMDALDFPGIDIIAPAGNYRRAPENIAMKLASSAAHTRGKTQVVSETYGAMGWELGPEEMRRLADWQSVRGVTRMVPHAFYYSIEGERYNECPPSMFFQSPHWPYMPALMTYLTRWTWILENTRPMSRVALYYPIDAVRAATCPQNVPPSLGHGLDEAASGQAGQIGIAFRQLADRLFRAKIDFEMVDDKALLAAEIGDGKLKVADLSFDCLVVPEGGLSVEAAEVADRAGAAGVTVLDVAEADPVEGAEEWTVASVSPTSGSITVTRRACGQGSIFLVVNEGDDKFEGSILLPVHGAVSEWDWATGQPDPVVVTSVERGVRVPVRLLGGSAACYVVEEA